VPCICKVTICVIFFNPRRNSDRAVEISQILLALWPRLSQELASSQTRTHSLTTVLWLLSHFLKVTWIYPQFETIKWALRDPFSEVIRRGVRDNYWVILLSLDFSGKKLCSKFCVFGMVLVLVLVVSQSNDPEPKQSSSSLIISP
jgi:hypothetical protein